MKISSSNLIMRHCPHCDNICLFSKADIDILQAENKSVRISCHQCQKQFSIDSDETNDKKIGRPAKLKLITCPSCKNQVAMPHSIPNLSDVDMFCPFCNGELHGNDHVEVASSPGPAKKKSDFLKADFTISGKATSSPNSAPTYMPLYILAIICLGAYLFWAYETGQLPIDELPIDQWLKILE